jgi:hypothetical protein
VDADHARLADARAEAERMMRLGHPVGYAIVRALLRELDDSNTEIAWLRNDRNRWQEAYCEVRLDARRRDS